MVARLRYALALIVFGVILVAILLPAVPDLVTALRAWEASLAVLFGMAMSATLCAGWLSLPCGWAKPHCALRLLLPATCESWSIPLLC